MAKPQLPQRWFSNGMTKVKPEAADQLLINWNLA